MLLLFHFVLPLALAFEGQEYWSPVLNRCNKTVNGDWTKPDMKCYVVNDKLHFFKVEVLSTEPILLRYHQLVHRRLCRRVLDEVETMQLERAAVVSTDPNNPTMLMSNRVANSTWVLHRERVSFNHMFNTLQRTLLALDLSKAESFQVLSYNKDGHYAPHYDFLDDDVVSTVSEEGNRIVTVLTILQKAKKATIFPFLDINVKPGRGDVLVWLNMNVNYNKDLKTLHAACPIWDGTKIGATLWVRAFGQEFRLPTTTEQKFSIEKFLKPNAQYEDRSMFCKPPGPR